MMGNNFLSFINKIVSEINNKNFIEFFFLFLLGGQHGKQFFPFFLMKNARN